MHSKHLKMKEGVYNKENIKQADRCSFVTLVAYYGAFPMKSGNCFAVISGDVEYKVVNFNHENLCELIERKVVEWPINIIPISDTHCVIADHRIPREWYSQQFCETCTPKSLWPPQQKLQRLLDIERGNIIEKKVNIDGVDHLLVKKNSNIPSGIVFVPYTVSTSVDTRYMDKPIDKGLYGQVNLDDEQS